MPRNGSGVYSLPGTYEAVSGEIIEAQQHNDPLEDLQSDANATRPVVAGGSGASTAVGGFDNFSTVSSNIASATTTDLSTATGIHVTITGTTTITGFGTEQNGALRFLKFSGILTLTHNASSLRIPGGVNITTAANDTCLVRSMGSGNWEVLFYTRATDLARYWEPISNTTYSAAASAAFTNLAPYRSIRVTGRLTVSSDGASIFVATSTDGGANYDTAAASYNDILTNNTGVALNGSTATPASGLRLDGSVGVGNNTNEYIDFSFELSDFNQAARMSGRGWSLLKFTDGTYRLQSTGGERQSTTARDAFRIAPSAGNITGYIIVEGVRG